MASLTASCHSPQELALSKLTSHLSFASGSQHDVGATRIGRRKAPAQFPFRSPTAAASLDGGSVWGPVLQQNIAPSTSIAAYEVAWEAATSLPSSSSSSCQTGEFSSLYSPETITKKCYLSTAPPSQLHHVTAPPDPVPNPLCPEDHACIPVSWRGESRGKGVAVGDGSVCLLDRNGMGNSNPGGPVDKLQTRAILPIVSHEDRNETSQREKIGTKPEREFPGREFRNDLDDGQVPDGGTDEVFWGKSTTRKPAPAAAWDWDRMSSQNFPGKEPSHNKDHPSGFRGKQFRASESPTISFIGRPIVGLSDHPIKALPLENKNISLESMASIAGQRQERAVRRLKSVIGHFTGVITLSDSDQQRKMEQAWGTSSESH